MTFRLIRLVLMIAFSGIIMPLATGCGGPAAGTTTLPETSATTKILSIQGGPVYVQKSGEQEWREGKLEMEIKTGDRVKTDPGSLATIVFFEGSTVELESDTEISLKEISGAPNTTTVLKFKQEIGTTMNRVKKLADTASSYEIETPVAVAGVRGTIFKVTVLADGTTTISNVEGSVFVSAQGKTIILEENTEVTVEPGQAPGEAEPFINDIAPTTTAPTSSPVADISTGFLFEPAYIWKGDTITIDYWVKNTGNIPLSDISISETTGEAVYSRGDENSNNLLEPTEIWYYITHIETEWNGPDTIPISLNATGISSASIPTSTSTTSLDIHSFIIRITSPEHDSRFTNPTVTITGKVGDPSFSEVEIRVNTTRTTVPVTNMTFSGTITLSPGENSVWCHVDTGPTSSASTGYNLFYDP